MPEKLPEIRLVVDMQLIQAAKQNFTQSIFWHFISNLFTQANIWSHIYRIWH